MVQLRDPGRGFRLVLAARAVARVCRAARFRDASFLGLSLAVLAVPAFALTDVKEMIARRRAEERLDRKALRANRCKPDASLLRRPAGIQPRARPGRPGLRSLALSGIRVDRARRAAIGLARHAHSRPGRFGDRDELAASNRRRPRDFRAGHTVAIGWALDLERHTRRMPASAAWLTSWIAATVSLQPYRRDSQPATLVRGNERIR